MITVGVRQVKNNLSRYLASVKRGKTVLITERGRPIARLVSEPSRQPTYREKLSSLAARGVVELPRAELKRRRFKPLSLAGKPLSQMILEDRR